MRAAVGGASWLVVAGVLGLIATATSANPRAATEQATCAGVSLDRLARVDAVMQDAVATGRAAGIVTYVARAGRVVQVGAYGMADREGGRVMRPDTIFRIASQTKAVTSVAAMQLVERGALTLLDPVAKYIPEFAAAQVLAVPGDADVAATLQPLARPITIRDLLTHTSGLAYGLGAAKEAWASAGVPSHPRCAIGRCVTT